MPSVKIEYVCKQCGVRDTTYPSQPRQFCSLSCRSKWQAEYRMPTKPRRGITEPCPTCGTPVYRQQGQPNKRFCSKPCRDQANRKGVEKACEGCGTAMMVVPSYPNKRFCSRPCYEAHRIKRSGIGRMHNGREVIKDHAGYLRIWQPDHPMATQGRILEHRWVMEQSLDRYLRTDEHVHHLNGVKDDNRPENLQLMDAQDHRLLTAAEVKDQRAQMLAKLAEYERRFGPLE